MENPAPGFDPVTLSNLKDRGLKKEGLFVGEGRFTVERMLSSGWNIKALLCTSRWEQQFAEQTRGKCPVHVLSDEAIEKVAGFPFHRGVLAIGERPEFPALEKTIGTEDLPPRLIFCPEINDQENLGSIIRSAAAFGWAVLLGPRTGDPLSRRVIKVSVGTVFSVPFYTVEDEIRGINLLNSRGYKTCAAVIDRNAGILKNAGKSGKTALVFGCEAEGLQKKIVEECSQSVRIPIIEEIDSLNVGVAAGIFLYHFSVDEKGNFYYIRHNG